MKKKLTTILLLITMLSPGVFVPPRADAQLVVSEIGMDLVLSIYDNLKEFVFDKLPLKIAKKVLDNMTESVIQWSAGGFKKEGPSFISNFNSYAQSQVIDFSQLVVEDIQTASKEAVKQSLAGSEIDKLKQCEKTEKLYKEYEVKIVRKLLTEGFVLNDTIISFQVIGPDAFNNILASYNFPPYALNKNVNPAVLSDFIREVVITNEAMLFDNNIAQPPGDTLEQLAYDLDQCEKTIFVKVRGNTFARELTQHIGLKFSASKKGIAAKVTAPTFKELGSEYTKSISENWVAFQTDASRGGWSAYGEAAKFGNTPGSAKYLFQKEASDTISAQLAEKTQQVQRSGGFLDSGKCNRYEVVGSSSEEVCIEYEADTPGASIKEAVNQKILGQYNKLENVDEWTDLLLLTGVKLVSGVLSQGVVPLANNFVNNKIDQGLACLAGDCDGDAYGQTSVISQGSVESQGGNFISSDEVVDIESVLYGNLVADRDEFGNLIYERFDEYGSMVREIRGENGKLIELIAYATPETISTLEQRSKLQQVTNSPFESKVPALPNVFDIVYRIKPKKVKVENTANATGGGQSPQKGAQIDSVSEKTVYEISNLVKGYTLPASQFDTLDQFLTINYTTPQYAVDYSSTSGFKLPLKVNSNTKQLIVDSNGRPVINYKRANGSLEVSNEILYLLNSLNTFIKSKGIYRLMELDHALPGPDLGWEERLKKKTDEIVNSQFSERYAERTPALEVIDQIESRFKMGITGAMKNDPFDVAVVRDKVPYTSPEYFFSGFNSLYPAKGPGALKVNSDGTIEENSNITKENYKSLLDTTFPKQLNLQVPGGADTKTFDIVDMNTNAGYWFDDSIDNSLTKQVEGRIVTVDNIPEAQEMREIALLSVQLFEDSVTNFKRRGADIRSSSIKLKELKSRYEALPVITPQSTFEIKSERIKKENDIAYEISLIREKLPLYDELQELKINLKNALYTYDRMGEMIYGSSKYSTLPDYKNRFGDLEIYRGDDKIEENYFGALNYLSDTVNKGRYSRLFLKDKLGILYCGLQDHSYINKMTDSEINAVVKNISKYSLLDDIRDLGQLFININFPFSNLINSKKTFRPFGGYSEVTVSEGRFTDIGSKTLGHLVPFRCYVTSSSCDNDEIKCNIHDIYCPKVGYVGHGEGSNVIMTMPITCQSVYRSSLGDYINLVESNSSF